MTTDDAAVSVVDYVSSRSAELRAKLLEHGAILLRGFRDSSSHQLASVVRVLSGEPLEYIERSSPRSRVNEGVYTSTDYPSRHPIQMHNECSYTNEWPQHLYFLCEEPAASGGQTPIADSRAVLARLSLETRESFREHGWMYVRNVGGLLGLSVKDVFQTEDRAEIERYCSDNGITVVDGSNGAMRLSARRDAILRHPETGEESWFNHISFFNVLSLGEKIRRGLVEMYAEEDLPSQTFYGDGTPIPSEVVDEICSCYQQEQIVFEWRQGDLLIMDNMIMAHGRRAYQGRRRVCVSMGRLLRRADFARN